MSDLVGYPISRPLLVGDKHFNTPENMSARFGMFPGDNNVLVILTQWHKLNYCARKLGQLTIIVPSSWGNTLNSPQELE